MHTIGILHDYPYIILHVARPAGANAVQPAFHLPYLVIQQEAKLLVCHTPLNGTTETFGKNCF